MGDISEIMQRVAIVMPSLLLALVFHEYAHAWMANRFGDKTSAWSGRLTLNPAAHIDVVGTLVFPLISIILNFGFFFGWAKPVPIDTRLFRNYRKGLFWVAFAGPLANIIFGFITAFLLIALLKFVPESFSLHKALSSILYQTTQINFVLAFFNLIPIPPLDGSNMLLSRLGPENTRRFEALQPYSIWILLALMYTGALRIILMPVIFLMNLSVTLASTILGFAGPL